MDLNARSSLLESMKKTPFEKGTSDEKVIRKELDREAVYV